MANSIKNNKDLQRVEQISRLLDSKFTIPGTNIKFGLDPIFSLIPLAGDLITYGIALLLIFVMYRNGASGKLVVKMVLNASLDALIGAVPIIGTFFDIGFKANNRNFRLLKEFYQEDKHRGTGLGIIALIFLIIFLIMAGLIFATWELVKTIISFFLMQTPTPINVSDRIPSLDFLRGIAVLGILIINIESFSYPEPWSPYKYGYLNEIDHWTRFWVYFLAQGKFFGMFTLLFGVGFYIFLERMELKGLGIRALDIYSRRILWLFIFGVLHAYLIWDGDILYHYAAVGLFLFPFRSFSASRLLWILLIPAAILMYNSYQKVQRTQAQYEKFQAANELPEEHRTPDDIQVIKNWERRTSKKGPVTTEVEIPRQTYWESIQTNASHVRVLKGSIYFTGILYRTLIMMILGIILYKLGVFRDYHSLKHYWPITLLILAIALFSNYFRYYHWTFEYNQPVLSLGQEWLFTFPKELLALAYVLFFNGLYQKFLKQVRFNPLSMAGRMALTNYISQSIICGLIFYGYGIGLYNRFSRTELLWVVLCIWILQLVVTLVIMRRYRQGPLESLWRKLTYNSFKD